jgi:gamma-glutamylcyclotransferase (GGCT)/AIG2-like uncharacterized protein YtfP
MKVFVYGTLKQHYGNNHVLEGSKLIGVAVTIGKWRLFNAGFPVLRPRARVDGDWNTQVTGEVYEVTNPETLRRLDALESEGRMYHRKVVKVRVKSGVIKAAAYVGDTKFWSRKTRRDLYQPTSGVYVWPAETREQLGEGR